jgi:class 3 adenylate cyclase/predicted ATPase/DNA-binding transcriptional ArsR family regulator
MEDWLRSIGLAERIPAFRENRITADQLRELTDDDLRELGLTIGERLRFKSALAQLGTIAAAPPDPADRPDGTPAERRPLTIMFVDLEDSSKIGNRLDPEDLMEVYKTYRETCDKAIGAAGGHVARFVGDGILAYFGYPLARENDPERAARAALDILRTIGTAITPADSRLHVRIGIATGRVLVSQAFAGGLSFQDMAVGSIPNLAARLQSLAGQDGIVVSEPTYLRIQSRFACEPLGEVALAGFEGFHRPWRVLSERSQRASFAEAPAAWNAAFQGRRGELEVLRAQWSSAERSDGNVVLIIGEAGIGKTRLIDQFLTFYLPESVRAARLAASALDESSTLFPFIDYLRASSGIEPAEPSDQALKKIAEAHDGSPERGARLPILSGLLGISMDDPDMARLTPQQLREKTLATLTELLLGLADDGPVCLVFEDLHWLDPTSAELLELLARRVDGRPILLLLSARTSFTASWVDAVDAVVLRLQPLSVEHASGLLQSLFGETPVPPHLASRVAAQTDGVPLFIEGVARTLLEQRQRAGSVNRLLEEAELPIPASLDEALVARLDHAGPAKGVAQAASVFGRSVRRQLLAAVCDLPADQLLEHLLVLVEAGILDREARGEREAYRFHHALLRDAAYASLVRDRRRELHVRAARALASLDPTEAAAHPEILALHLAEGGHVEEAVPHWLQAARRDLSRSALHEASRRLRRALTSLERLLATPSNLSLRLEVSTLLGPALSGLTGPHSEETREHYTKALELCRQLPEHKSHFPIYWAWWRLDPFNIERATALLDRAVTRGDPELLLQAHHGNWACRLNTGSFERCCEHVATGLSIYHQGDYRHLARSYANHDPKVCAHGSRAQAYWMQGRLKRAMDDEQQALSWANEIDHVGSRVHALGLTLLHRVYRRDYKEVFDRAGELIAFTAEHGVADHGAAGLVFRGWVIATQGDPASGLKMLEEGLARQQEVATSEDFSVYLCLQAEALAAAGQADNALETLFRERPQFDRSGLRIWLPEVLRMTGEMTLVADPTSTEKAREAFLEARRLANSQRVPMLELRLAMSEARLGLEADETAAGRLRSALAMIPEPDGSADLLEAQKLLAKTEAKVISAV